jgi:hypothetical protein
MSKKRFARIVIGVFSHPNRYIAGFLVPIGEAKRGGRERRGRLATQFSIFENKD